MYKNEPHTVESMAVSEALGKKSYALADVVFDSGGRGNLDSSIVSIGVLMLQSVLYSYDLDTKQSQ